MNALTANAAFRALQGVARSVKPIPASISLTRSVADFCGQDATKMDAIMAIGSRLAAAACQAGISHRLYADDFALLKSFVEHLEGDFALSDFIVPDTAVDQQHSRDESHFLDQEKR